MQFRRIPYLQKPKNFATINSIKAKPLDKAMWGNTILNRTDTFLFKNFYITEKDRRVRA